MSLKTLILFEKAKQMHKHWQKKLFSSVISTKEFFLSPPEVEDDAKLRRSLGFFLLTRIILLSVMLGVHTWTLIRENNYTQSSYQMFWTIGITYALTIINALAIKYSTYLRISGYSQLSIDVLLATLVIYSTSSMTGISLYLIAIVASAMVFNRYAAVVIAAFSGLCYALLTSGLFSNPSDISQLSTTQNILSVYISMVATALAASYFAKQLEHIGRIASERADDIAELNKQQEQLFNEISNGIITLDINSAITSINEAAKAIIGLKELDVSSFIGLQLEDIFSKHGITGADELIKNNLVLEPKILTAHCPTSCGDIYLSYSIKPLNNRQGEEIGKIIIFDDISSVHEIKEHLKLHQRMTELLAETTSQHEPISHTYRQSAKMIGESSVMKKIFYLVDRISTSKASVLITGESGTGKELIAKTIHAQSDRSSKPFVAINCGAIPENLIESELFGHKKGSFTGAISDNIGLFRQANQGTIFLDEIGDIPIHLQAKLLRVLQERSIRAVGDTKDMSIDVRIIAATNKDLRQEVAEHKFREDLYYRLNVVQIVLPPLRDRKEDIPLLVQYFVSQYSNKAMPPPQIAPETIKLLTGFSYPGNIRELENIVEHMLVIGGQAILPEHLPEEILSFSANKQTEYLQAAPDPLIQNPKSEITQFLCLPIDLEKELAQIERHCLTQALEQSQGKKKTAASLLGLNFRSLRYRLKKYGLSDSMCD